MVIMSDSKNNENNNQEINDDNKGLTIAANDRYISHYPDALLHQIRLFSGLTEQDLRDMV
jgi:hypothetical protein